MAYILDMLMQLEERPMWEKVRRWRSVGIVVNCCNLKCQSCEWVGKYFFHAVYYYNFFPYILDLRSCRRFWGAAARACWVICHWLHVSLWRNLGWPCRSVSRSIPTTTTLTLRYEFFFFLLKFPWSWLILPGPVSVSSFALSQDKVHIPGAIFLSVKFDSRCHTEEGCDELLMASSSDFLQDLHTFSGSHQKWTDFEIPGESLRKWRVWVINKS